MPTRSSDRESEHRSWSTGAPANSYLSEYFQFCRDFWWRQGESWYDIIGKFVAGEYRLEDLPRDTARLYDDWIGIYQGLWELPLARATRGHVPNVVFVLDAHAEALPAREVPVPPPALSADMRLVATPLTAIGGGSTSSAYVRGEIRGRGRYVSVRLVDAGPRHLPPNVHYVSLLHTRDSVGPRMRPVALVHVFRHGHANADAPSVGGSPGEQTSSPPGGASEGRAAPNGGQGHPR